MNTFVYKGNKRLRCGYTTGSCAAAAAKAATSMLFSGEVIEQVSILTPKGVRIDLMVKEVFRQEDRVCCAIEKDSGDDADVTNGILVYATVTKIIDGILIDGGEGIGRVTKKGLDQEVGQAAINRVPRQMIYEEVKEICEELDYTGGIKVIISVPKGEEIAKKTFNPRLGIEGGISILGTSGIVEPMSEIALIDTIRTEMSMLVAEGKKYLIATPGNYGETFASNKLELSMEQTVKCSNFIGETIDMAYEFGLKGLLLVGHIGKLVKLGAGIMNTHSKWADGRMEILCCNALLAGGNSEVLKEILNCVTTDEAIELLDKEGLLDGTMKILMEKIDYHISHRAYDGLMIGAILFSNQYGLLGKTSKVNTLLEYLM